MPLVILSNIIRTTTNHQRIRKSLSFIITFSNIPQYIHVLNQSKMDPSLFIDEVPSHFLCCVCFNVVEDPVEHTDCDNIFCSGCSSKLLSHQSSCPLCRGSLKQSKMRPLNRILKGQYYSLKMMCLYAANGCGSKFTIAEKACHEAICNHY